MTVVLLLDEAQNLTMDQYLELQYLTNLETPGQKLIEIIMTGQPLLEKKLAAPVLAALRQRAAVRCKLEPLDFEHTRAYVAHRLKVAGALGSSLFTPVAIELIYRFSRGVPRLINIICERCLIVGYVEEVKTIDEAIVEESAADQNLESETNELETPIHPVSHSLQQKMAARIESMEKKIDMLVQMMAESKTVQPEAAELIWAKRWFESLKRGPLILPAAKRRPVVAEENSAKRWISSLRRLPNGQSEVTH
jgi:general secretion pathway protein A